MPAAPVQPRNRHTRALKQFELLNRCVYSSSAVSRCMISRAKYLTERRFALPHIKAKERTMLNNLSEQIRECLQHAEDCARKAAELPSSSPLREDFLRLEKRWLELARGFEFGESLDIFTKNNRKLN